MRDRSEVLSNSDLLSSNQSTKLSHTVIAGQPPPRTDVHQIWQESMVASLTHLPACLPPGNPSKHIQFKFGISTVLTITYVYMHLADDSSGPPDKRCLYALRQTWSQLAVVRCQCLNNGLNLKILRSVLTYFGRGLFLLWALAETVHFWCISFKRAFKLFCSDLYTYLITSFTTPSMSDSPGKNKKDLKSSGES